MRHRISLVLLVLGLLAASPARPLADEATPLTPERVRALLNSLSEVTALGAEFDAADDPLPQIAGGDEDDPELAMKRMRGGMLTGAIPALRAHAAWSKFEAIADKHGFDSVEEWANVGDRVMASYLQLQLAQQAPDMKAQMEEARASIMDNPDIPEAQKAMMLEQFERQMGMFTALENSEVVQPGDLAVVEPMAAEIESVLQRQE